MLYAYYKSMNLVNMKKNLFFDKYLPLTEEEVHKFLMLTFKNRSYYNLFNYRTNKLEKDENGTGLKNTE